jgi:hypothetical protein
MFFPQIYHAVNIDKRGTYVLIAEEKDHKSQKPLSVLPGLSVFHYLTDQGEG